MRDDDPLAGAARVATSGFREGSGRSALAGVPSRVAVIGGGVSGLVAARDLARGGADVRLFEAERRLGGRIEQVELGRAETGADSASGAQPVGFDIGAEAFATRGGAVAALAAELGIADRITRPAPLGSWSVSPHGALPMPAAGALGIPAAPLSAEARRILGLPSALRAAVEPLLPARIGARTANFGDWVAARLGRRTVERLVRPVTLGVYSAAPSELPVDAMPELSARFASEGSLLRAARGIRERVTAAGGAVAAFAGGMRPLVAALERELRESGAEVSLGTPVGRVERRGPGWAVLDPTGAVLAEVDAVLLAVPEAPARELLALPERPRSSHAVEVIALLVDDARLDAAPRGTGALVSPPVEGDAERAIRAKALTHATAKWPDRALGLPAGRHLLRLSYGRAGSAPETAGLDDDAALALALSDASRILGVDLRADDVRGFARRTWAMPLPSRDPSQSGPDATAAAALSGLGDRIALAGDWISGTGLAAAVPAARAAAQRLLAALARTTPTPSAHAHPAQEPHA